MRYIMRRGSQRLRYEIVTGSGATPYAVTVTALHGAPIVDEQFAEPFALQERALQVEQFLRRHGWSCREWPAQP